MYRATFLLALATLFLIVNGERRHGGGGGGSGGGRHGGGGGGGGRRGAAVQRALVNTLCNINEQPTQLKSDNGVGRSSECRGCVSKCPTSRSTNSDTAKCFADCNSNNNNDGKTATSNENGGGGRGGSGGGGRRRQAQAPFRTLFRSGSCRELFGCYRSNCTATTGAASGSAMAPTSSTGGASSEKMTRRQQQQDTLSATLAQRQVCVKDKCQSRLQACQNEPTIVQLCTQQRCLVPCLQKCDTDCADVCRSNDNF